MLSGQLTHLSEIHGMVALSIKENAQKGLIKRVWGDSVQVRACAVLHVAFCAAFGCRRSMGFSGEKMLQCGGRTCVLCYKYA